MKNQFYVLTLALMLAISFSAYAGGEGDRAAETGDIDFLRVALTGPQDSIEVQAAVKFGDFIRQVSDGQLAAGTLAAGAAGGERDIVESQQIGALEMSVVSGILQSFDEAMMILEWEFLFRSNDHVRAVWNSPLGDRITERLLEKTGIRVLGVFQRLPRNMTTVRPIRGVEDLQGLNLRVPEMPARVALWRAMGASPTPLSFPEVYTALQTGTLDGQENPIDLIMGSRFYEVAPNLAVTEHVYGFMLLTIAEDVWQALTPEQQRWVEEASAMTVEWNDTQVEQQGEQLMAQAEDEFETITHPDVSEWRERTQDVYKQFTHVEGFEEIYLGIVEIGEAMDN